MNSSLSKQRFSGPRGRFIFFASATGPGPAGPRRRQYPPLPQHRLLRQHSTGRQARECAKRGAAAARRRGSAPWRAPSGPAGGTGLGLAGARQGAQNGGAGVWWSGDCAEVWGTAPLKLACPASSKEVFWFLPPREVRGAGLCC